MTEYDNHLKARIEIILKNSERVISEHITVKKKIQHKLEQMINYDNSDIQHTRMQMRDNALNINHYITIRCDIEKMLAYLKDKQEVKAY